MIITGPCQGKICSSLEDNPVSAGQTAVTPPCLSRFNGKPAHGATEQVPFFHAGNRSPEDERFTMKIAGNFPKTGGHCFLYLFNDVSYFVHANFSIDYPALFFKRKFVENVIAIKTVEIDNARGRFHH